MDIFIIKKLHELKASSLFLPILVEIQQFSRDIYDGRPSSQKDFTYFFLLKIDIQSILLWNSSFSIPFSSPKVT